MRQCGECSACCITPAIPALKKPPRVPCKHLGEVGCSIYGDHPHPCKRFRCDWLDGYGEEDDRPDKTGVIVWTNEGTTHRFREVN